MKTYFKKDMKPHRKKKRETDEAYKAYIRSIPCLICGKPSVAHHEPIKKGTSGTGSKCNDRETLPLCHFHHIEDRHRVGKLSFWKKHGIDYIKEIRRLQSLYKKKM